MSGLPLDTDYSNISHVVLQLASCYAGCNSVPRVGINCRDNVCDNDGDEDGDVSGTVFVAFLV